jgi:hypothetical protein
MEVFKFVYLDDGVHPDMVEIVKSGSMVKFYNLQLEFGRINGETVLDFKKAHGHLPQTDDEACELFVQDGYYVERVRVFE